MALPDPHELMSGALILRGKKVDINQLNKNPKVEGTKLTKDLVDNYAKNVIGWEQRDLDKFMVDDDMADLKNLGKAISVSNYVIDQLGEGKVDTVWQTGAQWDSQIKKFNPSIATIKNYNSSDIVLKIPLGSGKDDCDHYWGISLKKRGIKDKEPTLLNKPVVGKVGFLTEKVETKYINNIKKAKAKFFTKALKLKTSGSYKGKPLTGKDIDKLSFTTVLKYANDLFRRAGDEKNQMLTGRKGTVYESNPNIYFEEMNKAFMESFNNEKQFFFDFLDLVFKINMDQWVKDRCFHFSLMTGVGGYDSSNDKIEVQGAEEKEGRLMSEILRNMFKDEDKANYIIRKQPDKRSINAFEDIEGKKPAKLFFEMIIGPSPTLGTSIVDFEVRYKGDLTPEPQFQVFVNKIRKNSIADKYKKEALTKALGKKRWQ
mgnify:FL=1|jgi:hypothetical protein|tara:strand:- start:65 stop:1351 length:1287 start_codon:yes stop_codon:yes gene_type:complete